VFYASWAWLFSDSLEAGVDNEQSVFDDSVVRLLDTVELGVRRYDFDD